MNVSRQIYERGIVHVGLGVNCTGGERRVLLGHIDLGPRGNINMYI